MKRIPKKVSSFLITEIRNEYPDGTNFETSTKCDMWHGTNMSTMVSMIFIHIDLIVVGVLQKLKACSIEHIIFQRNNIYPIILAFF